MSDGREAEAGPAARPLGGRFGGGAERRHLSERARERLRIAAALLRAAGARINDHTGFCEGVQATLAGLSDGQRLALRELVNWVEEYNSAEAREAKATRLSPDRLRPTRDRR